MLASGRTLIMGIVNVTPDSFSDGGRFLHPEAALAQARRLVAEGADLIDVGAESTRPGHAPVPAEEELERLLPVLELLRKHIPTPISVDTRKAAVAERALTLGVEWINDVGGLSDPALTKVVAQAQAGLILMHPGAPGPGDPVAAVVSELDKLVQQALAAGVQPAQLIVDPGLGFGKHAAVNLALLKRLPEVAALGYPVLVGPSRKRTLQRLTGLPAAETDPATAAACVAAVAGGASLVRVHNVALVRQAVQVADALYRAPNVRQHGRPTGDGVVGLEGMTFLARHGALAWEAETPQPFQVDVHLWTDVAAAAAMDDPAATADYRLVYERVQKIMQGPRAALLETLCERIAAALLDLPRVRTVKVRVAKLQAPLPGPLAQAAVEIIRGERGRPSRA